jgi:hypothetical protein
MSAATTQTSERQPVLYLSHGAPPLADDTTWTGELAAWSSDLPRPSSVLIVSAHWELAPIAVSATSGDVPLLYDFWGFPQRYYEVTYDAPGAPELAQSVAGLLSGAGESLHQDPSRGLDHGAYVPLEGDVPAGRHPRATALDADPGPAAALRPRGATGPAARRRGAHRRVGLHHAQPRVVQPLGARTPHRRRRRPSSTTGLPRPSGGAMWMPCSTSSPRHPPLGRRTRAPSTGLRCTSPWVRRLRRVGWMPRASSTASGTA